ncbi:MAG: hypothetical protein ACRET4_12060, partial [Steroidobacteraceae bacterium]
MLLLWVACGWGFAEATLFFIVPDVWLSYLALKSLRRALIACVWALLGALLGAAVLYAWARSQEANAIEWVAAVPGVGSAMLRESEAMLREQGAWALFPAMLRGMPYKTFVVAAPRTGIDLLPLLAITVPARLLRFALVSGMTHWIANRPLVKWT